MTVTLAKSSYYFGITDVPILIGRSRSFSEPDDPEPHPHDLTEIEHVHDFSELMIVSKGFGIHCLEGTDFPVSSGDVFLLQGHQRHYFHKRRHLEMLNVMYDPKRLDLPESDLREIPGYSAMFLLEPQFRKQHQFASHLRLNGDQLRVVINKVTEMEREEKERANGYKVMLRSKLMELITYLSRTYGKEESTESEALMRIGHVIGVMEKDYHKDWKLEELVSMSHMSKSNLMTVFRKATGRTPMEHLLWLRIQRSIEMMQNQDLSITQIAFSTGFNDSNYFSRRFRKITGQTPRQYRSLNL